MARLKHKAAPPPAAADKSENRRSLNVERSAYFSRREAANSGDAEKYLMRRQEALQSALADCSIPRYVRVQKDDLVPDLLVLPLGSDLRGHPLVMDGSIVMQASSVVAAALAPKPGWEVSKLGSWKQNCTPCSSNERKKGNVMACELNEERVRRLKETIGLSGTSNIKVVDGVFLDLNPEDPQYSKVRAILLEHSCSGSGTASARLDYLLPSSAPVPEVESFVHSTCSVNQVENEDVIKSVLPLAASHGFQLETAFPKWHRHGLPSVEGAECLVRTDPKEDKEGFFIAPAPNGTGIGSNRTSKRQRNYAVPHLNLFKL
ncbi:unnamed protein product [Malus baccata var. baccata]